MKRWLLATTAFLGGMIGAAPTAAADDTVCVGELTPGTYDNIVVPPGVLCLMQASAVQGNIQVLENAQLFAFNNDIRGNIEGDKAETMQLLNNTIGGNIQIKEGETPNNEGFDVFLCNNILTNGNIQVEKMKGSIIIGDAEPAVAFACQPNQLQNGNIKVEENRIVPFPGFPTSGLVTRNNDVAANVQVFKNRNAPPKTVQGNFVGQNLQCFENDPVFVGGPNFAGKARRPVLLACGHVPVIEPVPKGPVSHSARSALRVDADRAAR